MADPIFNPAGAGNPQTQTTDTHQDIFGGSNDIFNNPDVFQPVEASAAPTKSQAEDFGIDFGQLQANQHASTEPQIIEPQHQETREEYQARQIPPQAEIIEQHSDEYQVPSTEYKAENPVIEPQMKPEVKVNPRKQPVQAPTPRPQVQTVSKPINQPVQAQPQVSKPQVRAPKPQVQATSRPINQPIQVQAQVKPQAPVQQPKPQIQVSARPINQPVQIVKRETVNVERQSPTVTRVPGTVQHTQPQAAPVAPVPRVETAPQNTSSDLQRKLNELVTAARNVYALEKKDADQVLELLGANNDKVAILYQITLPENGIAIKKIETDTSTDEENVNDLAFVLDADTDSLQVILDDVLLLDEVEQLQDDSKKKMQVTEKLNKFIFLLSEQQKKIEKEAKEREEAEQERRRLQDIFRNF